MPKKYDFVFVFEVKQRELDSICLLKVELEKRGYSVKIMPQSTWYYINHRIPTFSCKILVLPWGYRDENLAYGLFHIKKADKIINMQWEQIYRKADQDNSEHIGFVKGISTRCAHIAWGEQTANKLIQKCGVPKELVGKVGNPSFDFLKPKFKQYYLDSGDLKQRYNLPRDSLILLYISSFSHLGGNQNVYKKEFLWTGSQVDVEQNLELSKNNRQLTITLFDRLLDEHPEITLLYRLHPSEVYYEDLLLLKKKHKNFVIIKDLSLKQWIYIADQVYTWQSTGLIEAYFANKPCYSIGYPDTHPDTQTAIYENMVHISAYEELEDAVQGKRHNDCINKEVVNYYYGEYNEQCFSYVRIVDFFEKIYVNRECKLTKADLKELLGKRTIVKKAQVALKKSFIYDVMFFVAEKTSWSFPLLNEVRKIGSQHSKRIDEMQMRHIIAGGEIETMINKIRQCIE